MEEPRPACRIESSTAVTAHSTQGLRRTASGRREAVTCGGSSPVSKESHRSRSSTTASYITHGGGAYPHRLPTTTNGVGGGQGRSSSTPVPYRAALLAVWRA